MMDQIDAIIFDVDGTLWDSRAVVARAWNQAVIDLKGENPGYTANDMTPLFGNTMDQIARMLFPDMEETQRQPLMRELIRYEDDFLTRESGAFYPGVSETIRRLACRYPLYILSNCQSGYIESVMDFGGFRDCITDHLCFEDTHLPKGDNLRQLIARHGLKNPVYVGDTGGDWKACQQAGIPMIFAAYGLGQVEGLPTIHSFPELETLLP